MSVDFTILHSKLAEVNQDLFNSSTQMRQILDTLQGSLKNISVATGGVGEGLWIGQQNKWNMAYDDMNTNLVQHAVTSDEVAEIFKKGDNSGALAFG